MSPFRRIGGTKGRTSIFPAADRAAAQRPNIICILCSSQALRIQKACHFELQQPRRQYRKRECPGRRITSFEGIFPLIMITAAIFITSYVLITCGLVVLVRRMAPAFPKASRSSIVSAAKTTVSSKFVLSPAGQNLGIQQITAFSGFQDRFFGETSVQRWEQPQGPSLNVFPIPWMVQAFPLKQFT
jgi:hypothetical protein